MRYATNWTRCWSVVGAVGVGLSFLVCRPSSILTAFVAATVISGILLLIAAPEADPQQPRRAGRWVRLAGLSASCGAAVVAVGAVLVVVPSLALPLVLAAIVSSPPVVDRIGRWHRRRRADDARRANAPSLERVHAAEDDPETVADEAAARPAVVSTPADLSAQAVRGLGDAELCREWRRSFVALTSAARVPDVLRIVGHRQIYLDELHRRSPSGMQAWLSSGARAAGGPERFLTNRLDAPAESAPEDPSPPVEQHSD